MITDTDVYVRDHFMSCLGGHQVSSLWLKHLIETTHLKLEMSNTTNVQYPFQDKHEKTKLHVKRRHSTVIIYFSGRKGYGVWPLSLALYFQASSHILLLFSLSHSPFPEAHAILYSHSFQGNTQNTWIN